MTVVTKHGRGGMVYMNAGGSNILGTTLLGSARRWQITVDQDFVPTDDFVAGWHTYNPMPRSWKVIVEGNLDVNDDTPFRAMGASNPTTGLPSMMCLYPDASNTARFYQGVVWPVLMIDVDMKQVERYTLTGTGHGPLMEN